MEQFYLTLPSNSSMMTFPDNKLNSYKVKLSKNLPITEGKWTVGLYEIQFPKTWYNITNAWVKVRLSSTSIPLEIGVKDGFYKDMDQLVDYLRKVLKADARIPDEKINFGYDQISNRLFLQVSGSTDRSPIGIGFSQNLLNIFGFSKLKDEGSYFSQGEFTGGPTDINEGFYSLYVYTDLIEHQFVGDSMLPLLRVVPFKNDGKQEYAWVKYNPPQYCHVLNEHRDTIEININRDNGKPIPFQHGKVVVTLKFERVQ